MERSRVVVADTSKCSREVRFGAAAKTRELGCAEDFPCVRYHVTIDLERVGACLALNANSKVGLGELDHNIEIFKTLENDKICRNLTRKGWHSWL